MSGNSLYHQLSRLLGAADSKILPALIAQVADEEEIRVLMAASPPATVSELSEKAGIPREKVEGQVRSLFRKGMLFHSRKDGEPRYYRVKTVPQFHDSSILWEGATAEFHALWKEYTDKEWPEFGRVIEAFLPRPAVRVVPVGANIESKAQVLPLEDVREIVNRARTLAVTRCTCRVVDGKCGKPLEACIQINRAADYALQRGTGRAIDREEALRILDRAEREGLVHVVDNRQKVDHIICNCCRDCCIIHRLPDPRKFLEPSRFRAAVNPEECLGCQACLDRCMFGAIVMEGEEPMARVLAEKCLGCGLCTIACPAEAIAMEEVGPPEGIPA